MSLTRRRFLTISATAAGAALVAPAGAEAARWRGRALGAPASLRLTGMSAVQATPIFTAIEAELARLEDIFSLYRSGSALTRLNTTGHLAVPPPELLEVLSLSDTLHKATSGAFDPTVQPLFLAYAEAKRQGVRPTTRSLANARARVGWTDVRYTAQEVTLQRHGAALTLNGIAQGYITDRITDMLRGYGLTNVLIDMGEIAALGHDSEDGRPWEAGLRDARGKIVKRLRLSDRALASSDPTALQLSADGKTGHIFDPGHGNTANGAALVSVSAPRAALADGLSTALCVLDPTQHARTVNAFPGAKIEFLL